MRRTLALVALLLASPAPAAAQWGEAPAVALGSGPATCLRDAGPGFVSALASQGRRYGATLFAAGPDGLRADGEVIFGRRLAECPVAAAATSGAAVVAGAMVATRRPHSQRLLVAVREPGGAFGAPLEVARMRPRQGSIQASVAVAEDGSAIVAWRERYDILAPGGRGRVVIRVARRGPREPFGLAETLLDRRHGDRATVGDVVARLDGAGRATVAWPQPQRPRRRGASDVSSVMVASAARGAGFAQPAVLARDVSFVNGVALAVAADGRALVAHGSDQGVRVYERAPGAAAFSVAARPGADRASTGRPVVALAPDGSAVVAWRNMDDVDAVVRTGTGAWGRVAHLQDAPDPDGLGFGAYLYATGGPPVDRDEGDPRAAAADGGELLVAWREEPTPAGDPARAWAASASRGAFARAAPLGSPVRDADAVVPALTAGGPIAVWADNRAFHVSGAPRGGGRLHLARPDAPRGGAPAPAIRATARRQTLYHREPLLVRVRCAAACDVRAVIAPRRDPDLPELEEPRAAVGVGGRDAAGLVTVRVKPASYMHVAPPGGGTVPVVVRATAPAGTATSRTTLRVPVRRRPVPPLQPPLDVRARRLGGDVLVTWRTAAPARRLQFVAFTRRTRGRRPTIDSSIAARAGHRRRHFRVRLRHARGARFVVLQAGMTDPPFRRRIVVVPIR